MEYCCNNRDRTKNEIITECTTRIATWNVKSINNKEKLLKNQEKNKIECI